MIARVGSALALFAAAVPAFVACAGADVPDVVELLGRADRAGLHAHPRWHALLHYEPAGLLAPARSRVVEGEFFLAPDGAHDPRAELRATLRAFFDPGALLRDGEHAQCAFGARRRWLESMLTLAPDALLTRECATYERWRAALDPQGLTLIFPEGFMNNPASMFGHTLLRIDAGEDLLGHAVDFTAFTGDDRGVSYLAKGVLGLYDGRFLVRPYHQQLKRYADWENRDVWEYRLAVAPGDLDLLVRHLWELRDVALPYYFFTKNCSYELLRVLEVAVPDLAVSDELRGVVIPVDTVRAVAARPDMLDGPPHYRPSPETRLRTARRTVPHTERRLAREIARGERDPDDASLAGLPPAARARTLDLAYEQLRYEFLVGHVTDDASRGLSRRILVARSRVHGPGVAVDPVPVETPPVRPDQSHASARISLRAGWRDDDPFVDLRLRPAFHGLLDDDGGHTRHAEIAILDTRIRFYPEDGQLRLQELTLIDVTSLSPRSHVFRPWAWSLATGLRTRRVPHRSHLDDAPVWGTRISAGLAWNPYEDVLLYGLGDVRLDVGPDLDGDVSFGPGGRVGVYAGGPGGGWKGHVFGEILRFAAGEFTTRARGGVEARLTTSRNTALVVDASGNRIHGETWLEGSLRLDVHF